MLVGSSLTQDLNSESIPLYQPENKTRVLREAWVTDQVVLNWNEWLPVKATHKEDEFSAWGHKSAYYGRAVSTKELDRLDTLKIMQQNFLTAKSWSTATSLRFICQHF